MNKPAAILCMLSSLLWAADSWQSKPFTEWSDRELQKILTNSAWARVVSVVVVPPAAGDVVGVRSGSGAGEKWSRPQGLDPSLGPGIMTPEGAAVSRPGGGQTGASANEMSTETQALRLTIRWQSALPVKQALMRARFGSQAGTSPEAKVFLDQEKSAYVIAVSGLPAAMVRDDTGAMKALLVQQTALARKGKDRLQPSDIELGPPGPILDVFFLFPKSGPFVLEDKEVEFSTRFGALNVKCKFHLKDMVYYGTLEL